MKMDGFICLFTLGFISKRGVGNWRLEIGYRENYNGESNGLYFVAKRSEGIGWEGGLCFMK